MLATAVYANGTVTNRQTDPLNSREPLSNIRLILTSIFALLLSPSAIVTEPESVGFYCIFRGISVGKRPRRAAAHTPPSLASASLTVALQQDVFKSQNMRQNRPMAFWEM